MRADRYTSIFAGENYFAVTESAVNLQISPAEFIEAADHMVDVDKALSILGSIGFADLPERIPSKSSLQTWLDETHAKGDRLNILQIDFFNNQMMRQSYE